MKIIYTLIIICFFLGIQGCETVTECDLLAADKSDPTKIGDGVDFKDIDAVAATAACKIAVENTPDSARFMFQYSRALFKAGKAEEAESWALKSAQKDYPMGQFLLARAYSNFDYTNGVSSVAEKWYKSAANKGLIIAQLSLGIYAEKDFLNFSNDKSPDIKFTTSLINSSLEWYHKAADQGSIDAALSLSRIYGDDRYGTNIVDKNKSFKWAMEAATEHDVEAQYILGTKYQDGQGVDINRVEAMKWYLLSAKQGSKNAKIQIKGMYSQGVAPDGYKKEALSVLDKNYTAVIWCGFYDMAYLTACFSGHTTLKVRINNIATVYSYLDFLKLARMGKKKMYITLPKDFSIEAQNSHNMQKLGIKILDPLDTIIFSDQVGYGGVISFTNPQRK